MIVITGAAGFIGSCLVAKLNSEKFYDLVLVDDFSKDIKNRNIENKKYTAKVERNDFFSWLDENENLVQFVFHIGARTDTTESDQSIFDELNLNYSKQVWQKCIDYGLPLIYASSAATYGGGELGYDDDHELIDNLKPLNPYAVSKNEFDKWVLAQRQQPYYWAGLKFFNVFGPNEYHKNRMASVVWHSFNQINDQGRVRLFRSHSAEYQDGRQIRDFIYVKDVTNICYYLMHHRKDPGIYNVGTGNARTFLDLVNSLFDARGKQPKIEFIDIPMDIRDNYQYFTEAKMDKLHNIGYRHSFCTLEEGVADYVNNYLKEDEYL